MCKYYPGLNNSQALPSYVQAVDEEYNNKGFSRDLTSLVILMMSDCYLWRTRAHVAQVVMVMWLI